MGDSLSISLRCSTISCQVTSDTLFPVSILLSLPSLSAFLLLCFFGVISMGVGVGVGPSFFSPGVGVVGDIGTAFLSADFCASDELFASVLSDINTFGLSAIFLSFVVLLIGMASSMFIIGMSESRFSASGVLLTGVVSSMFTTGTNGMSGRHFLQVSYSVSFLW